MGRHDLPSGFTEEQLRAFMKAILADVHALERMLAEDRFETGIRRIGAEQEMFLLDRAGRAWCGADAMMKKLAHPQFTYELAQFNLECNLHPQVFGGKCLSTMEAELQGLIDNEVLPEVQAPLPTFLGQAQEQGLADMQKLMVLRGG